MISPADSELSDSFLLCQYTEKGDAVAFDRLFARYRNFVYSACRSVLRSDESALDAVGATFLLLSKQARRLSHRDSVAGWLYETANLTARNVRRIEEGHMKKLTRLDEALARENPGHPSEFGLEESLATLKPADRKAVLLKFVQGFSYEEVGRALDCSEDAARMRVKRSLELLSQRMGSLSAVTIGQALERLGPTASPARPWLSRQSATIANVIRRIRILRTSQVALGGLAAIAAVSLLPARLHAKGIARGPNPVQSTQGAGAIARLPYSEGTRPPNTEKRFTLKYKALEKSEGSPDDAFTMTLSYDGHILLLEREEKSGAVVTSLFHGKTVTMILDNAYVPNAPPALNKIKLRVVSERPMDPSENEWSPAKANQAPPLTRYPMVTNVPPVGFSLPNPYLKISLDGSYSWFMGGGIPTTRDAQGNITGFGAYDATYTLSNYRKVGDFHAAEHIVVTRSSGDFRGPNTYDLISATTSALPPSKFDAKNYREGKLVTTTTTSIDWPSENWIYVPASTPDATITKIRQLATSGASHDPK